MFSDILVFLSKGGVLMIPLFICSILSLAVIIENSLHSAQGKCFRLKLKKSYRTIVPRMI